jgi:tRNA(Ile)-lysidine synthase
VTRDQTAAYCRARGLAWREDATNAAGAVARSRVRHGLLPALRAVHPAAEINVRMTAQLLAEETELLEGLVDEVLRGSHSIELARLGQLPAALARLVVVRLAEDAAGELIPGVGARLEDLLSLGGRGGTVALDLGSGVRAVVEYGMLRMSTSGARTTPPPAARLRVPGQARFGDWVLRSQTAIPEDVNRRDDSLQNKLAAVLDAGVLGSELVVRGFEPGDRMRPIGLGGSKSLSDLFTDRRLPRERRAGVPVVESGGQIAWVPGIAVSDAFRVTESTDRAVRLTAVPAAGPDGATGPATAAGFATAPGAARRYKHPDQD